MGCESVFLKHQCATRWHHPYSLIPVLTRAVLSHQQGALATEINTSQCHSTHGIPADTVCLFNVSFWLKFGYDVRQPRGGHLIYFYSIMSVHWVQKCTLNTDQMFTKLRPFSLTTSQKRTPIHWQKLIGGINTCTFLINMYPFYPKIA